MKKLVYTALLLAINLHFGILNSYSQAILDNTFSIDGFDIPTIGTGFATAYTVVIQTDGKILVAGGAYNGANKEFTIIRYNTNGTLDNTFDSDGIVQTGFGGTTAFAADMALQSDGKIVVAGYTDIASDIDFAVARYNTNGTLDNTFSGDGKVTVSFGTIDDSGYALGIQSDGKIVVAGDYDDGTLNHFAVTRLTTTGALDNTFDSDGKVTTAFTDFVTTKALAIQSNGKIIVTGTLYGADADFALARYNTNGSLDNTFDGDGKLTVDHDFDDDANDVLVQTDGKIVVGGSTNNDQDFCVLRFNSNGTPDNTFDGDGIVQTDISFSERGRALALQTDGKIILAGNSYNTNADFTVIRYNTDGTINAAASTDLDGFDDYAESAAIQTDGKIILAGWRMNGANASFATARFDGVAIGIDENIFSGEISVYPNPATNSVTILSPEIFKPASLKLVDVTGQTVLQKQNISGIKLELDVSKQQPGVYFLYVSNGETCLCKKLVKQ